MIITCSCCGRGIRDNEDENVDFGVVPNPHDEGFGMCFPCGGDKKAKSFKKMIGWAMCTFFESRFGILRKNLKTDEKRVRWDSCCYEQKCLLIKKLVEKGVMI